MRTIVVGVDGTRESIAALRYALREARLRDETVTAVAAWHVPTYAYGAGLTAVAPDPADFERAAEETLSAALAAAGEDPEVPVRRVVREGEAAHVLLDESEGADLLVVGCRHEGFLSHLLRHSVSGHCSRSAHCPVTVVHGT